MKKITSFLFFFLILSVSKASHNRAGEILYKRIAPFTATVGGVEVQVYTYSITVIKYTDDGPNIADRCVDTVYFGDGAKGIAPRINGSNSCGCGSLNGSPIGCGVIIVNDPGYKVKRNEYSIIHTYPGAGTYLIRSFDPNRNQGVHNIPNSVNISFYVESQLVINSLLGANSSPVLMNPPIDQATVGVCFYHNMGAVDSDGDSLSYEITTCRDQYGPIPGYFFPELGFNGSFTINPVTGTLTWCVPQFLDEYNIALIVKEWRKNTSGVHQLIGYVLRDMQVLVKFGVVGIHENNRSSTNIYPNPFKERLEIDLGASVDEVESIVYALDAKQVFKQRSVNVKNKLHLDLNALEPGIYMLCVKAGPEVLYKKIVKE